MARQVLILALVFLGIVGMASAAAETAAEVATAEGPAGSDVIGTTDGGDQDAAPVGGPVASGAFPASSTSSDAPTAAAASGASALQLSAAAGVAAALSAFVF